MDILKTAVLTCVVIAAVCGLYYGEPLHDESGDIIDEGFHTTFDSKAGTAVKTFIQLMVGAYIGVRLADAFRETEDPT